jgi:hypothetical protein
MPQTGAERQAAFRKRHEILVSQVWELIDEVSAALERGRCPEVVGKLPDEPGAAALELAKRMREKKLIACQREDRNGAAGQAGSGKPEEPATRNKEP